MFGLVRLMITGWGVRSNRRRALEHYRTAANAGNPNAEYHVGVFYHDGIAVRKNYSVAVPWLRKAVRHGDAEAMHLLGQCYRYGRGVPRNTKRGFDLELKAAMRGVCCSRGEGTSADLQQAFRWYLAAARRGHDDAAYNLGFFYENGRGVKANRRKAEFWYARAKALRLANSSFA
jgi:uncharacterized protein